MWIVFFCQLARKYLCHLQNIDMYVLFLDNEEDDDVASSASSFSYDGVDGDELCSNCGNTYHSIENCPRKYDESNILSIPSMNSKSGLICSSRNIAKQSFSSFPQFNIKSIIVYRCLGLSLSTHNEG